MRSSVLVLVLCAAVQGCAYSPQQLTPQPLIPGNTLQAIGHGQAVTVRFVDARSSEVLGTRGGLYPDSSTVSVSKADLLPKMQTQAEAAVRLLGFTPSVAENDSAPKLILTLHDLSYQAPKGSLYVTKTSVGAVLTVEVEHSGSRYSGRYVSSIEQDFVETPDETQNNQWISDALSDVLQRVFTDPAVTKLLAQ